jgi:hypothetical protein
MRLFGLAGLGGDLQPVNHDPGAPESVAAKKTQVEHGLARHWARCGLQGGIVTE